MPPALRLLVACLLSASLAAAYTATHRHHEIAAGRRRADRSIDATQFRSYCDACRRPGPQCLCATLPPSGRIGLATRVLVLQHPVEFRRKTVSTVPVLGLVLEDCRVLVGRSFGDELGRLIDGAVGEGRTPLLLFPGEGAITLDGEGAAEELARARLQRGAAGTGDDDGPAARHLLIIVDGTWTQARRMLRHSPVLSERCQAVQFTGTADRSIYDSIRKQPHGSCLSTLESCERTLRLLEPDCPRREEASRHLLESLGALIRTQIEYERRHLEGNPRLVRDSAKLDAKLHRQRRVVEKPGGQQQQQQQHTDHGQSEDGPSLPAGYTIRPLEEDDAPFVDGTWPYRSAKSLVMIQRQIRADQSNSTIYKTHTCLGIEADGTPVACIVRHRNGSVGMLHVDEDHRSRGLGSALLRSSAGALLARGERPYAFIVDGNGASERVFARAGFVKADPDGKKGTGKRRAKRLWLYDGDDSGLGSSG